MFVHSGAVSVVQPACALYCSTHLTIQEAARVRIHQGDASRSLLSQQRRYTSRQCLKYRVVVVVMVVVVVGIGIQRWEGWM